MTSEKDQKYDRQLRLWGAHGQRALESARVLLLNGDGVGSETLKNVVLPGVGAFAVLDEARVSARDTAANFFVDAAQHVGQPRALAVAELLGELNGDVRGESLVRSLASVDEALLRSFSLVVASNVEAAELQRIAGLLFALRIPLVVVRACGFIGYVRVVVPEHNVVEAKLDNAADDLRVSEPFAALRQHALATPLAAMDSKQHSHFPWICVLVQFAAEWRAAHGGALPSSAADKKAFKQAVRNLAKSPTEENIPEAHAQAHLAYTPYRVPADVRAVLDAATPDKARALPLDAATATLPHEPPVFWRIMAAVAAFVAAEGAGKLPLAGNVPDLTATTEGYLALQTLYADQARRDVDAVAAHLAALFGAADAAAIGRDAVRDVCRQCASVQHIAYRSLAQELADAGPLKAYLGDPQSDAHWVTVMRAADAAAADLAHAATPDAKLALLRAAAARIVGTDVQSPGDDRLRHWLRADGAQLHNTAAVLGGIASQEIIKLITHQYVPLNNTFIWNGLKGVSATLQL
jgi:amyloid beta precursor protein binding protein 1